MEANGNNEPEEMHDAIARRAYELFAQRGYQHGHDIEDWFQAEAKLAAPGSGPEGAQVSPEQTQRPWS